MRPALLLALLVATPMVSAQPTRPAPERYADVRVSAPAGDGAAGRVAARLAVAGVGLDHAAAEKRPDGTPALRTVLSEADIAAARAAGLRVDVLDADLAATVARRTALGGCPVSPYPVTGTMGCYPTFVEAVAILDQMRAEFPALVSARTPIGTSGEGRPVWMVELGDNPGVDEGEPEVLFTAVHHAREPGGLVTVLYTLWDLLRRGDAEAQYLLANRRLFVVPILNPDGYVYNQTTDPAGGGLWRKNRRANADGSVGVDLNRNYGFQWGRNDTGSSPNGAGQTYRGPAPFSEPETAALRAFVDGRRIRLALNYHSYSDVLIYPWGYEADLYTPDSAAFVEVARAMTADNGYGYGTANQVIGYTVNGSSDDWMYGDTAARAAILAYTPEVGSAGDGFWPSPDRIVPIAEENIAANRFALLAAGGAPAVAGVEVQDDGGNGFVDPGETALVGVVLGNVGRGELAGARVRLVSSGPDLQVAATSPVDVPLLGPGSRLAIGPFAVVVADGAPLGDVAGLMAEVTLAGGYVVALPLPALVVGTPETLLADDASSLVGWTAAGAPAASGWGRSTSVFVSPPSSFADSPVGDYAAGTDRTLTRAAAIDLTATPGARLRFRVRWDTEPSYDGATVEAQVGSGPWTALAGRHTRPSGGAGPIPAGTPVYDGTQTAWQHEEIDLGAYAGQSVRLRFRLRSDSSVEQDGLYVDDLAVLRLVNGGTVASEPTAAPGAVVALGAAAPNPARGRVRIPFTLAAASDADVSVFDALGRRVAVLHAGAAAAGTTVAEWDASAAAPGVYVVRLRAAAGEASRRVVVH